MKRDVDLIRNILLKVEETDDTELSAKRFTVEGYDETIVARHIELLQEADLVDANIVKTQIGTTAAWIHRLTWSGHEFLDAARNDTVWNKAKDYLTTRGVTLSFEALKLFLNEKALEWLN